MVVKYQMIYSFKLSLRTHCPGGYASLEDEKMTHPLEFEMLDDNDSLSELTAAAQSSLDFWNNSFDDDDWNAIPNPVK